MSSMTHGCSDTGNGLYTKWKRLRFVIDKFETGDNIPLEYENKLGALEILLLELIDSQSRHIQCEFPNRPGFSNMYDFCPENIEYTSRLKDSKSANSTLDLEGGRIFGEDPLYSTLVCLIVGPDKFMAVAHSRAAEYLYYQMSISLEDNARIDETLDRKISDLMVFQEMLTMVRLCQPRPRARTLEEIYRLDGGRVWRYVATKLSGDALAELDLDHSLQPQAVRAFQKLSMPSGKRDETWVKQINKARCALSNFWSEVRRDHKRKLARYNFSTEDINIHLEAFLADREPGYITAVAAERKETKIRAASAFVAKQIQAQENANALVVASGIPHKEANTERKVISNREIIQNQWGATLEDAKPSTKARAKTKTRKKSLNTETRTPETESIGLDLKPALISVTDVALVKKGALKVLRSLFPSETVSAGVKWESFVDAMAKIGFASRCSGRGSAVFFEPLPESIWYGRGKIVIHRPHPDTTLDSIMLQSIGKRMGKWFGWSIESFALDR
jgi:hypothetical protein